MSHEVAVKLASIRNRINTASEKRKRPGKPVILLAVSKKIPASLLFEASKAGQFYFGESYVQEARLKYEQLKQHLLEETPEATERLEFHLIGPLQRNKVKSAVGLFTLIHSVDREELAREISKFALALNINQRILVQINISGEASKAGVSPDQARELCSSILMLPNINLEGLMSIGTNYPPGTSKTTRSLEFCQMEQLRSQLENELGRPLSTLSMGMSEDFELAIEEGANIVRVGSAIFGSR